MRHKLSEAKKKDKTAVTIDEKLSELLDKYLSEKKILNKSKYIENLIREDMENRGENVEREF